MVVRLPETDMHVHCGGKGGDFHVVGPLARLSHLHHMSFKFLLQLFLGVEVKVDRRGSSSPVLGPALGIASARIDDHVLAVEIGVVPHVGYRRVSQCEVLSLMAIQLVRQGVEQAVA